MRINHNIAALNTSRQLNAGSNSAAKNMEKLSSGLRINRAGDDAAGLAISEKMRSQIRGLDMASKNAQDGISLIQTAEGALNETHSILQRMSELATQAANDTNTTSDRAELQKEMDQLSSEVTRISTDTEFNTKKLLDGTATDLTFQIGANEGQTMKLSINKMDSESLAVGDATKGIDISTSAEAASTALTTIKTAIDTVSSERAKLGAVQNRLEHTINNLGTSSENLTSAESRIRDVDMASEMMEYTKNNILTQASQAMLAQANQQPQQVLQLLKG
ncbi:flagellin Hag [Bacillus velezensis]|jgi:flagellin|uniref:flagellin Hag n=1 Tax=Bacillus TaxID=1386 RepID=UPI0004586874|nr:MULTISPECIES: flagellin Hag [Bacillus]AIW38974.1 flagellin [Bacillus subtilis]AHZ17545.1 Hag [Bacillus velezensis SQR9]AKF75162.1 flagellin [Bacillus velezensis]AKL77985.1 flagellin [Bacillus velezensis]AWD14318.1 flagellin [Bacillus velezensis]